MGKLILTRGVPASGKSTWAKSWVEMMPNQRARVNRDDLRFNMYGKYWDVDEKAVTVAQRATVEALLRAKKSVVVDDTNLRSASVREWLTLADKLGVEVEFKDFPITYEDAVARDLGRDRRVGYEVIKSFFDRYVVKGQLPAIPELDGPQFLPYQYVMGLPNAIIVDIDGTLAHMVNRGPYDTSRYMDDRLDFTIAKLVDTLSRAGHPIIIVSGRDAAFKGVLEEWLLKHGVYWNEVYMRPEGDTRNDAIVKDELYENHIKGRYNVEFVLDDRDRVVAMWRAKGVKVLQVEYGDF